MSEQITYLPLQMLAEGKGLADFDIANQIEEATA